MNRKGIVPSWQIERSIFNGRKRSILWFMSCFQLAQNFNVIRDQGMRVTCCTHVTTCCVSCMNCMKSQPLNVKNICFHQRLSLAIFKGKSGDIDMTWHVYRWFDHSFLLTYGMYSRQHINQQYLNRKLFCDFFWNESKIQTPIQWTSIRSQWINQSKSCENICGWNGDVKSWRTCMIHIIENTRYQLTYN